MSDGSFSFAGSDFERLAAKKSGFAATVSSRDGASLEVSSLRCFLVAELQVDVREQP